jgi:hypothetical protein
VIKRVNVVCKNEVERYWMFVCYVLTNHPGILKGKLEQKLYVYCTKMLSKLDLPTVNLRR